MIPRFIAPSIDRHIKNLADKYRGEIDTLAGVPDAPPQRRLGELMRMRYESSKDWNRWRGLEAGVPIYFILQGEYKLAWLFITYAIGPWHLKDDVYKKRLPFTDAAASEYWHPIRFLKGFLANKDRFWWAMYTPRLIFDQDLQFKGIYDQIKSKDTPVDSWMNERLKIDTKVKYDMSPEARHQSVNRKADWYTSYDALPEAITLSGAFLVLDQNEQAQEALFRLQHMLSSGEPPKSSGPETPKLRYLAPLYYHRDAWVRARLSRDADQRRLLGWLSVYWLLEQFFREVDVDHAFGTMYLQTVIYLIAECELMDGGQTEFLRYFKLLAMQSSVQTCKSLAAEATRPITPEEMKMPPSEECKRLYESVTAELAGGGKRK